MSKDTPNLFSDNPDDLEAWKNEWQDMPEFEIEDMSAYKQIIVNFEKLEDLEAFSKAIGQKLTVDTRSIWYPEVEILHCINKRYNDEP